MGEHRKSSHRRGVTVVAGGLMAGALLLGAPAGVAFAEPSAPVAPSGGSAVGNNLQNFLGGVGKNVQGIAGGLGDNLQAGALGTSQNVQGIVGGTAQNVQKIVGGTGNNLQKILGGFGNNLQKIFGGKTKTTFGVQNGSTLR